MKAFLRGADGANLDCLRRSMGSKRNTGSSLIAMASATPSTGTTKRNIYEEDAKVIQVHTIKEFDDALEAAKSKLVVVEYAASHSPNSRKIYPAMVELSLACQDAVFILVMGDESTEMKELCARVGIQKVPHFVFYKNKEIIHEEEGIGPDQLLGDVLYYGDPDAPIMQLHSKKDLDDLIREHKDDGKLLVVDVGLKHCGPCVKVYPTFVKLAKKMRDTSVFARINGDETDELMALMRTLNVVEVPTFLFIKDGRVRGRYVGSGKGELVGEILKYQGVRVTY
ncbi:hypothetical protein KP509_35G049800 [Ceratopteris richardii]|nr:hypothetical protein KP509_35G049800 [Ceratopteris richardii]